MGYPVRDVAYPPESWQKELDQIKANQLYTETVETLRLRYPDVKP